MSQTETQPETTVAKKMTVTTAARIVANAQVRVYSHDYGTPGYWKAYERELLERIAAHKAFVRDHRSCDDLGLYIDTDTEDRCSVCDSQWEPVRDDENPSNIVCASCCSFIEQKPVTEPAIEQLKKELAAAKSRAVAAEAEADRIQKVLWDRMNTEANG